MSAVQSDQWLWYSLSVKYIMTCKISISLLVAVAEQIGLSLTVWETSISRPTKFYKVGQKFR